MATKRDYYEILGVERTATKDAIKSAYRKLALKHHPDKSKEAGAEERFKELSEAYAVLSDDEKRSAYDRFGHAGVDQRWNQEDIFRGVRFEDIFGEGGLGDLGRIFEQFFGGFGGGFGPRTARRPGPPAGEDLRVDVELSLDDAYQGGTREVRLRRPQRCGTCNGSGARAGTSRRTCAACRGAGQVQHATRSVFGSFVQVTTCRTCGGRGSTLDDPCRDCGGEGRLPESRTLAVEIPPGVDDGSRLRLSGEGAAGPQGGPAGDLYVFVHVAPHARYQRDGEDLLTVLEIDYPHLVLGASAGIDTLDGEVEVEIPPGTKPGTRLRLKGKGMPSLRNPSRRGDLYVELHLRVPEKPSRRAKELLEGLREELGTNDRGGWFRFRRTTHK